MAFSMFFHSLYNMLGEDCLCLKCTCNSVGNYLRPSKSQGIYSSDCVGTLNCIKWLFIIYTIKGFVILTCMKAKTCLDSRVLNF